MVAATTVLVSPPAVTHASFSTDATSPVAPLCGSIATGFAHCFVRLGPLPSRDRAQTADAAGYGPADLQSAYKLPTTRGTGQLIAVVDAMDDPNAESDFAHYRDTFGLPACTTENGCFRKVNQQGQAGPYPLSDETWSLEVSLDLDMVSAACPLCSVLLVEATSSHISDLSVAVDTAARLGASAISNSYGVNEFDGMATYAPHFKHQGTTILAASGDAGYGQVQFPAVLSSVIAVGGTSLVRSNTLRGWTEKAWSGSGSGCSASVAKPSWQGDAGCAFRTVADLAASADPGRGMAVYDTNVSSGFMGLTAGWITLGGTSASAPLVAGIVGLAGNGKAMTPRFPYAHLRNFYDIKSGASGLCVSSYLCKATTGYDGPTGLGSPHGYGGL